MTVPDPDQPTRRFDQGDYYPQPRGQSSNRPTIDAAKLWAGGIAAAIVAALVAMVGILLIRGVLNINILAPESAGTYGSASTTMYVLLAAGAAIVATALLHLLVLSVPDPRSFFNWIVLLATLAAAIVPWTVFAETEAKIATSILNLVIGLSVLSIINTVGNAASQDF